MVVGKYLIFLRIGQIILSSWALRNNATNLVYPTNEAMYMSDNCTNNLNVFVENNWFSVSGMLPKRKYFPALERILLAV